MTARLNVLCRLLATRFLLILVYEQLSTHFIILRWKPIGTLSHPD